uniref:Tetratricopeptide repeat protein n=1 Tax=Desulfacinum infernum TaxID=35837 RepID=A0A832A7G2_9BACT
MKPMVFVAVFFLWLSSTPWAAADPPTLVALFPKDTPAETLKAPESLRARASLEIAWWHFKEKRYEKAQKLFDEALRVAETPALRREAQWGKALCLDGLGKRDAAAALIQDLESQGYGNRNTQRWLASYRRAQSISQRILWEDRLRREALQTVESAETTSLWRFTQRNERALRRCIAPEAFFEVAKALRQKGRNEEARRLYEKVLDCATRDRLRLGVFYELLDVIPPEEAIQRIDAEHRRPGLPDSYAKDLETLKMEAYRRKLRNLPEASFETEQIAQIILEKNPTDPEALLRLGWFCYHAGRYSEAEDFFARHRQAHPHRNDGAYGLAYTFMAQKKFREAAQALDSMKPPYPEGREALVFRLHMEEGAFRWKEKDFSGAEALFRRAAAVNAEDQGPWQSLGWLFLEQGRPREAADAFQKAYTIQPTGDDAEGLLLSLERSGDFGTAHEKALEMARVENPSVQEAAGRHYLRTGKVLHAASVMKDEKNDATPWMTLQTSYESRSGDEGTSRKRTLRTPWTVYVPRSSESLWALKLGGVYLDGGDPGARPFVGSFGLPQVTKADVSRWIESAWVAFPSITFIKEGAWDFRATAGSSPLGGPVDPAPTFSLELHNPQWHVEVHHNAVEDSLLSWIGQRDPYSDRTWGRVLKAGGSIGRDMSWPDGSWLSVRLGADHYGGHNVWRNFSVTGDAAVGRSVPFRSGTLSVGGFLSASHFDRNSDFYTYGHGGYFSPSFFLMTGPTVRYRSDPRKPWWLDMKASAGYLYYETEASPIYPRDATNAKYSGDRFSGLGYSGSFRAVRLLSPQWALGVHVDMDKSSDYTRWAGGVGLTWFFEKHDSLGRITPHYDTFFQPRAW